MIHTVARPNGTRFFCYVLDGERFVLAGPACDTAAEAEAEALRYYREGAHLPRRMRREERVTYCTDREVRTVSSMIQGKSAAAYWGGS